MPGDIMVYPCPVLDTTHHLFSFAVVLFSEMGRLLRWDCSGVIYSEAFQWKTRPDTLCEFFCRLHFLLPVDRSYDTTATSVMDDDDEAEEALGLSQA
jgi:hypothetical protein